MVTIEADGTISFAFFRPHAQNVRLLGSFNDWSHDAHRMRLDAHGWWRLSLRLPVGEYSFQYLVNGHEHAADFAAFGVFRNGYGAWESNLWVDDGGDHPSLRLVPGESVERVESVDPVEAQPSRKVA